MIRSRQPDYLIPTRRSLLSRLKDWNDQENWRVFFDTYWRLIYKTALDGGLTPTEAEDAVQETVISVMNNLPTFQYDPQKGSFKMWLLHLTRWRITDQLRKRSDGVPGRRDRSASTATVEEVPDPAPDLEAIWNREWEANLMEAAVERVKRVADPKQYQIFDLLLFKQWSVSQVGAFLGLNTARVHLAKHRIGSLVKKETAYLRSRPF